MSSSKSNKKSNIRASQTKEVENSDSIWSQRKFQLIFLAVLSFLLYANTITHDYTQDDAIVIYDNEFTTQGIAGIPDLLKYDTFRGFFKTDGKDKLVSGGRYRPLTPVMFAVEYQIFGDNPMFGHIFNILWYMLLVVVLYLTLERMLLYDSDKSGWRYLIFGACLLFAVHPIHTEAVANIKGRDEIVSLLGSLAALYFAVKAYDTKTPKHGLLSGLCFFLALMAKENTITYLAVIPLALYCFRAASWGAALGKTLPALLGTILFLVIRTAVIGMDMGGTPMELMNNPFLEWDGSKYVALSKIESLPTMMYCLGKYLQLMVLPHPLTHDYYPRHIEIMSWANISVIVSTLLYLGLGLWALLKLKSRSLLVFCIIYFIATISIVSNMVFPIGTNMSERFLFMPSVGFCLIAAYGAWHLYQKFPKPTLTLAAIVLIAMSAKTIMRNTVWQNDYTLFNTDVHTSVRSAKVLNAAGGSTIKEASQLDDGPKKTKMLDDAIGYLNKATEVHPNYKNAYLLKGNAYFHKQDYLNAIAAYRELLSLYPSDKEGNKNMGLVMREYGKYLGEKKNDLTNALKYLNTSLQHNDSDPDTYRLLGVATGISGNQTKAIQYFKKCIELDPNNAGHYVNLYNAYMRLGDEATANQYRTKALELNPQAFNR